MSDPQRPERKRRKTETGRPPNDVEDSAGSASRLARLDKPTKSVKLVKSGRKAGPAKLATPLREARPIEAPVAKKKLSLGSLAKGMPGLTPAAGQTLAEAAAVCFEACKHMPGVRLPPAGLMIEDLHVEWQPVDEQCQRCHADIQEATERGASGVAILVFKEVTGKVVVERSKKGTGFDYWMGDNDKHELPFQGSLRLEVSGILVGDTATVASRMRQKKIQITPTDHIAPGYVAVVEFGTPVACLETK